MTDAQAHPHHESANEPVDRVVDPVCGMKVDPSTTPHRAEHDGRTWYFCSAGCLRKFLAEPARYAGGVASAPVRAPAAAPEAHQAPAEPKTPATDARIPLEGTSAVDESVSVIGNALRLRRVQL